MSNELTKRKTEIAAVMAEKGAGELIKPLKQEIHLFDTFVAGTTHLEDPAVLEDLMIGDPLVLQREDNKFDDKAILILTNEMKKIGYVPERDNVVFSRLMDAGKKLIAKIKNIEKKGSFNQISIGIYLVDF